MTKDDSTREVLQIHLRGGQTIELTVTNWGLKKKTGENELTELRWQSTDGNMPYIRLDAVDAVSVRPVAQESRR